MNIEKEKLFLESDINYYKLQVSLGVWQDKDEQEEQRRRLWKLNIINRKEDDEFLDKMGLVSKSEDSHKKGVKS